MVTFDAGETLAERFRSHMGHSSSLYGYAMRGMADDWEAGGPTREACRGWEDSPNGTMVQLRFLAGVFRLVLAGAAPELVPYYPCLGGTLPPDGVWPVMREVVGRHTEQVHEALAIVPQTNEPGRSTALLVGLFDAVEAWGLDRIRLIEVGASGGLNLHVDRFRYDGPGWSWGPPDSPLVLHTQAPGVTPRAFEIVERLGCDVAPVDAASHEGALHLRSFVWPWQLERHERLTGALAVAAAYPVVVERAGAGEFLQRVLADPPADGVLTVVWQSITRMYWPATESARVAALIEGARSRMPLAHVSMEHADAPDAADAELAVDGRVLGVVHPHGIPLWVRPGTHA
ncbi:MAG TPA: DUF2332 domain-containing protein [Dermatophilaceae bacterium]|jgi:hypothetical protein|nr:DUF2332 domain-containing protein [Dermatophilaceae bacterium]HOR16162.1 DUF2332 domain-containing protein [Dermatophilaceae bacterium]